MVGDRMDTDVISGIEAGLRTVLVLTGSTKEENIGKFPYRPTRVVNSMAAASSGGNGYIILFHVGSASADAQALTCITRTLRERGFTFGTVPQVLAP